MFISRLATAIVLLAACISALLYLPNRWWTAVLLPVMVFAASWEWAALAGLKRGARWAYAAFLLASAAAVWFLVAGAPATARWHSAPEAVLYGVAGIFWLAVAPAWLARRWRVRSPLALALTGWIVIVPSWLALSRLQADPRLLLALLGVIWVSDTAAYLAGRTWGRHKLAPSISPGKTWEGVAGAAVAVAVYYVVLLIAAPAWSGWQNAGGAILFGAVALMGVVGDLFESWMKRQAAVKDSGGLLPGHGGVLDRIDSMTAALPIAALLLPFVV
jgi:phosphatidate cytidylyltransferase